MMTRPLTKEHKRKISKALRGRTYSRVEVNCEECKCEFTVHESRIRYGIGKFCSVRCSSVYRGRNSKGSNHYRWIKNRTKALTKHLLRGTKEWKDWRSAVFSRDNFTCKECGLKDCYIEPHHIVPIRIDEDKIFQVENGITLCRPCHVKTFWKELEFVGRYSDFIKG